jgi:hypothetical protein
MGMHPHILGYPQGHASPYIGNEPQARPHEKFSPKGEFSNAKTKQVFGKFKTIRTFNVFKVKTGACEEHIWIQRKKLCYNHNVLASATNSEAISLQVRVF